MLHQELTLGILRVVENQLQSTVYSLQFTVYSLHSPSHLFKVGMDCIIMVLHSDGAAQ